MKWSSRARSAGLLLLSLFIIWHAIGIGIVGPFAHSYMRDGLMTVYKPYLSVLHLNNSWPFYAPNPFLGSVLNYQTVNQQGETQEYPLTHAREKFDHAYFRYTNVYAYLFSDPEYSEKQGYDKSVAKFLCHQHDKENLKEINFILLKQKMFTRKHYMEGKRPLDEDFLEKVTYGPYACDQTAGESP